MGAVVHVDPDSDVSSDDSKEATGKQDMRSASSKAMPVPKAFGSSPRPAAVVGSSVSALRGSLTSDEESSSVESVKVSKFSARAASQQTDSSEEDDGIPILNDAQSDSGASPDTEPL